MKQIDDLRFLHGVQVGDPNLTPTIRPNACELEPAHCTRVEIMGPPSFKGLGIPCQGSPQCTTKSPKTEFLFAGDWRGGL